MKKCKFMLMSVVVLIAAGNMTAGAAQKWNVVDSSQKFIVNGKPADAAALNINDSNYIKAAEFAKLLDIDIHFDEKTNTISFDKAKPYSGVRTGESNTGNRSVFRMEGNNKFIDVSISELKGNDTLLFSGMFMNKGEMIQYHITGEGSDSFTVYCTGGQSGQSNMIKLYSAESISDGAGLNVSEKYHIDAPNNQYFFYITNNSDKPITNISGTITVRF